MQVHGEYESVVIALLSTGPISAKEFKRKFPREFEKIKGYTNGANFTQKMIDDIVSDLSGIDWEIEKGKYTGYALSDEVKEMHLSRLSEEFKSEIMHLIENETNKGPTNEELILMCIDVDELDYEQKQFVEKTQETSQMSSHPTSSEYGKYAIGWIRYTQTDNVLRITEVQSDILAARKMCDSPIYKAEARRQGLGDYYLAEVARKCDSMQRYTERVYEDSIAMIFLLAAKEGLSVEMLTSKDKEDSPISVYEDLPKSMGMIKGNSDLDGRRIWKYQPPHLS